MHAPYRDGTNADQALVVRQAPSRKAPTIAGVLAAGATVVMGILGGPVVLISTATALALVHRVLWSPSADAADALAALPFPVVHDRNDAMAMGAPHHVLAVIVRVRDYNAAIVTALPTGVHARISGTELTLTGTLRSRAQLAALLTGWGVAVHERFGIVSVDVAWSRTSGPPMSL